MDDLKSGAAAQASSQGPDTSWLRLRVLELASAGREGWPAKDVVAVAEEFSTFVGVKQDGQRAGANIHGIGPDVAIGRNPKFRGDRMDFGQALYAMKDGLRVGRAGWNGKGMFAYLVPPASYPVQTGAAKEHFGEGTMVPYRAYLALKTVDDDVATWAPSASDAIAEDWCVIDGQ